VLQWAHQINTTLYLMTPPRYRIEIFRNTTSGAASYTALKAIMIQPRSEGARFRKAFVVTAEESLETEEIREEEGAHPVDRVAAEWEGEGWILHQNIWKGIRASLTRHDCDITPGIKGCPAGFARVVPPRSSPAINEGTDRTFTRRCVWLTALAPPQRQGATRRPLQIPARLYRSFLDFMRVKDARNATLVIDYDAKSPDKSRLSLFAANRFGVEAEVSSQDWGLIEPLHTYVNLTEVEGPGRYDMAGNGGLQRGLPSCAAFMWGSDSEATHPEADEIEVLQWPPTGRETTEGRVLGITAEEQLANPRMVGAFAAVSPANARCEEFEKAPAMYCKICDTLSELDECEKEEGLFGCEGICAHKCDGKPCA